jgi:hypothetical protein
MCTKCLDKEQWLEILPLTLSSLYSIFYNSNKFFYAIEFSGQGEACLTCLFAAARHNLKPLSANLTQNKTVMLSDGTYEYSKGLKRS